MGLNSSETNTIYLSREFLQEKDSGSIAFLLLEEIGHRIDRLLNTEDSRGDEGAIFALLVSGKVPTQEELQLYQFSKI